MSTLKVFESLKENNKQKSSHSTEYRAPTLFLLSLSPDNPVAGDLGTEHILRNASLVSRLIPSCNSTAELPVELFKLLILHFT